MLAFVKYKFDFNVYEKAIQAEQVYEVTRVRDCAGERQYTLRGLEGWFDAEYFEELKPHITVGKNPPVVGYGLVCYEVNKFDDKTLGLDSWTINETHTDRVNSFYRCGIKTFVAFTKNDVYILQIE